MFIRKDRMHGFGGYDGAPDRNETPIEKARREAKERESLGSDHVAGLDSITNADGLKVTKGVNMTSTRGNIWSNRYNPNSYGVSDELGDRDPVLRIVDGVPEMTDPTAKITEPSGGLNNGIDVGEPDAPVVPTKLPKVIKKPFYETEVFKVIAALAVLASIVKLALRK